MTAAVPLAPIATPPPQAAVAMPEKKHFRTAVDALTPNNINVFKKLHSVLFPIAYKQSYFTDALKVAGEYAMLGYFNDVAVGEVCARIESGSGDESSRLYLLSLGVLAPYRRYGLGSKLLEHIVNTAKADKSGKALTEIYLHVATDNTVARSFYERRGFVCDDKEVVDYYPKMKCRDAHVLRRKL